jgi:DNA-binding response OmpR family regulator
MSRVMVVVDDPMLATQIETILGHHGHAVTTVGAVESALFAHEPTDYDLVILDVFMGGLEGIAEFRDWGWDMPIISTSAGYHEMAVDMALDAAGKIGANGVLPKPFTPKELTARVTQALL